MDISSDPYEQKLFQMFKSCDTHCSGLLDELALTKLCRMLELRDQGSILIETLTRENSTSYVSFGTFKEALLSFLGTELDGTAPASNTSTAGSVGERTLIINDEVYETFIDSPHESSDREVSPKFIVGSKKYGRRSRPQSLATESSQSDSDEDPETVVSSSNNMSNNRSTVQRSSSQIEMTGSRRRRPKIGGGHKLKRCASLPAQKNLVNRDLLGNARKKSSQTTQTQQKLSSSVESLDMPTQLEIIPAHSIIEMWDRVCIPNGKGLLLTLGFDEDEVNTTQLLKVLEEELRGLEGEAQTTLLKASMTLQSAEIAGLRQTFRQLSEENKKLHANNKDANRRVAMLAQEIDDRHASLEDTTKKEIRMLEQRHAEVVRDLTARMANDRENWSNLTARLEKRIKTLEHDETKLKAEMEAFRTENCALEGEQQMLQKQITDLLETNIQLNREIADLEDRSRTEDSSKGDKETEEVLDLIEKITILQAENSNLRDKNDELVVEVEGLNFELSRAKTKKSQKTTATTTTVDLAELTLEDAEHGGSAAVKRRGDSPSKTRITEESPRLGKFRKCTSEVITTSAGNSESDTSGDWVALDSELKNPHNSEPTTATSSGFSQDASTSISALTCSKEEQEEEIASQKAKISQLEAEIKTLKLGGSGTVSADSEERCKELENSLEQMQKEYEDTENYWQLKLSEERKLFDKERQIYEDEQHESDKKFTELMEKVREYEEQYSKDGRLSPIEEKDTLEQQYADLEAEAEEIRENARRIFEEKTKEIEWLQSEIEDLRMKLGESVEILTGASEMNPDKQHQLHHQSDMESPASSPISYLWHQSTIQSPAKDYQMQDQLTSPSKQKNRVNLSTSETALFSTTATAESELVVSSAAEPASTSAFQNISPIQKPIASPKSPHEAADVDCDSSSSAMSGKSFETHSVASTHSVHPQNTKSPSSSHEPSSCSSPSDIKEELKRLKFFEISLKEQINDLTLQRDGLVMELQQLHEARPVLEKAYARAAHPSLIQRVNQLELKNRHLQNVIKQQQQYTESLMQQTWQQQHAELSDLRNRLETQAMIMAEQTQRLANADILVKELYVENSHLTATIQRLEQQRTRANIIHQHQHQHQGLSGLPGMP